MKPTSVVRCGIVAGGLALAGGMGLCTSSAFAAAQVQHGSAPAAGMTFPLGPDPMGLPSTCLFPNGFSSFEFTSGTAIFHDTANNNGDWGGETVQGPATFYEDSTAIATGHLTVWGGGGNNAQGQNEGGLTLNFTSPGVSIHVNFHQTVNAKGVPTANPGNVQVVCS